MRWIFLQNKLRRSSNIIFVCFRVKAGLHWNTNVACENDAYVYVGKFVDCWAFAKAVYWPYINVLYANSLWCTDSRRIAFGCLPNVRRTAECCLPRLRNTSTSNIRIIFACRIRVLFAFRCKRGLMSCDNDSTRSSEKESFTMRRLCVLCIVFKTNTRWRAWGKRLDVWDMNTWERRGEARFSAIP